MTEADLFDLERGRISGVLMFKETDVPVSVLFDGLITGLRVGDIVETYPAIQLERAKATIMLAGSRLEEHFHAQRL